IKAFEYSVLLNHQLVGFLGSLLCLDKLPFSLLLLRDVRHHRDGATARGPTAANAKPSPVRRVVLKTPTRRIAQALDAFGDQGIHVTCAVITVDSQISQEIGIETAGLK